MSFWAPIIAAGVNIAQGLLEDEQVDDTREASRETTILNLQDKERDRANDLLRTELQIAGQKETAQASLDAQKKRILGDVLLQQGQGQEKLGLEAFRSAANKPERFNTAASVLAQVLSR